jgi:hypothetical protein
MLKATVDHLIANVLPAARDYNEAEQALSNAFAAGNYDQTKCQADCELVERRAVEVAVAIDLLIVPLIVQLRAAPLGGCIGQRPVICTGEWRATLVRYAGAMRHDRQNLHSFFSARTSAFTRCGY